MISLSLWLAATGIVAVSFESFGAALVLFGIAGLLIEVRVEPPANHQAKERSPKWGPLCGLKSAKSLEATSKIFGALRPLLLGRELRCSLWGWRFVRMHVCL
jgi:hypothetical protein